LGKNPGDRQAHTLRDYGILLGDQEFAVTKCRNLENNMLE